VILFERTLTFGHVVGVAVDAAAQLPLVGAEESIAAAFEGRRRATFTAGRAALRHALAAIDAAEASGIAASPRGAPRLGDAAVGSISHKDEVAVALAACRAGRERIGVDVELVAPLRVDISRRVLCDEEHAFWTTLPEADRARVLRIFFSLKEAIYKAIDPFVERYVGFREVALGGLDALTQSGGSLEVHARLSPAAPVSLYVEAAFELVDVGEARWIVSEARATPRDL